MYQFSDSKSTSDFIDKPKKWKRRSVLLAVAPTAFILCVYYGFATYRGYATVPNEIHDTYVQVIINPDNSKNVIQSLGDISSNDMMKIKAEVTTPPSTVPPRVKTNVVTLAPMETSTVESAPSTYMNHFNTTAISKLRLKTPKTIKQNTVFPTSKPSGNVIDLSKDRNRIIKERNEAFLKFKKEIKNHSKMKHRELPGIIGIGVEKCGTGALSCMLENHPMLRSAVMREAHFFDRDAAYFSGIKYYLSVLPYVNDYQIAMEKSPNYFVDKPDIPYRIKRTLPGVKLYTVLCDPVNRTYSDFIQETWTGHFPKYSSFNKVMRSRMELVNKQLKYYKSDEKISKRIFSLVKKNYTSHIITHGMYYYHLQRWLKVFKPEEILVVNGDEIMKSPWKVVEELQDFLGIPKFITKENFVKNLETGFYSARPLRDVTINGKTSVTYGQPMCFNMRNKGRTRNGKWWQNASPQVTNELQDFYRPYNEKLYNLLGKRFSWQT